MRVYIPLESPPIPCQITVPPDKARYLITVMRVRQGDQFEVIDGAGNVYEAKVVGITWKDLRAELNDKRFLPPRSLHRLILCQSLLKGPKIDLVVQKTTELGVSEVCPIITERSVLKETSKIARWRKIAEEASEQSGRTDIPVIHEPRPYESLLTERSAVMKGRGVFLSTVNGVSLREGLNRIAQRDVPAQHGEPEKNHLSTMSGSLFLIVGPEGGFTSAEAEASLSHGLIAVSMGDLILRAETAAIAAVAITQYFLREEDGASSAGVATPP